MNFKRKHGGDTKLDFELNIVPIIDCFTILVTFMLAAGVYISITALEVGVSGEKAAITETKKDGIEITVRMLQNKSIRFEVSGEASRKQTFQSVQGSWNYEGLATELKATLDSHQNQKSLTLIAHPEISYQEVIKAMEISKRTHPEMLLGGF